MQARHRVLITRLVAVAVMGVLMSSQSAFAGVYAGTKCVSGKQKEAGKFCKRYLKAWAKWDKSQDDGQRDQKLADAQGKLDQKWDKLEMKASQKGADCADTTPSSADLGSLMGSAMGAIVDDVNTGLDLVGSSDDRNCGQKILNAAAKKCSSFLKAESKYLKKLAKDPDGNARDAKQSQASLKFSTDFTSATAGSCATAATEISVEEAIDELVEDVVATTIVSPNVNDAAFDSIVPPTSVLYDGRTYSPRCIFDTEYRFFAKRGTENKLVMYYQGGGACWDSLTCSIPVCADSSTEADNPNLASTGFADLSNPNNPFKDWNIVFVSYCSCDVHYGDSEQDYGPPVALHRGYQNARVVEQWARDHFVNPEVVMVTGSSAGAYGALFNAPLHHDVWPASQFHVLADAGNGVITQDFFENEFSNWDFAANLPKNIPGVIDSLDPSGEGMVDYIQAVASYFSDSTWSNYSTAYDGGQGGQTGFYNVMLTGSPIGALVWWNASCAFNDVMRAQAIQQASENPTNYRYYIGTGSRHTMYGSDKVYTDTTGGVPTIVDWVNGQLASGEGVADVAWTNVECSDCGLLLPGDVQPTTGTPPFCPVGSDVKVICPTPGVCPSPSGAFLDSGDSVLD